jgi:GNAT superfamily N-acetyltransferase
MIFSIVMHVFFCISYSLLLLLLVAEGNIFEHSIKHGDIIMPHDMLVKLYELDNTWDFLQKQKEKGILIRKPIGTEKSVVINRVKEKFGKGWASEAGVAIGNKPISCFIATKDNVLIGFACYDATALGFFGPTGVDEEFRGLGIGKALLMACLLDMKLRGYGYAIIGAVGPAEFYARAVGATIIPDSWPGIYDDLLK